MSNAQACAVCERTVDSQGERLTLVRHHKTYSFDSYVGSDAKRREAEIREHPERFVFLCRRCHNLVHILAKLFSHKGKQLLTELIQHDPTDNFVFEAKKRRLELDRTDLTEARRKMALADEERTERFLETMDESQEWNMTQLSMARPAEVKRRMKISALWRDPDEVYEPVCFD